jgi:malate dehydrogenase
MLESYFFNKRKILPCCAFLEGEYNINNLCVGVPVVIGKNGIEEIVILDLEESEENELFQSSIAVKELVKKCKKLLV